MTVEDRIVADSGQITVGITVGTQTDTWQQQKGKTTNESLYDSNQD